MRSFKDSGRKASSGVSPNTVWLAMHQDGVAAIPIGIKKGQALGGVRQVNANVGNHKDAFKRRTFELQIHAAANFRATAVSRYKPFCF